MRKRKRIVGVKFDHVFCRINTGEQLKNFSRAWVAALKEAGIENFHFHDLRHTFCSNLIMAGAGLKDVKDMVGHSDIRMTDRYTHLTMEHMANQQKRLQNHYLKAY
ncbi:site-specific integrase [Desulfocicer niacini]